MLAFGVDGMSLIAFDYKSFHVLTLGFEAQDRTYMRLARLDMHSYFALVGLLRLESSSKLLALPDEELSLVLKHYRGTDTIYPHFGGMTFQEIRDEKAKRAILGIGFGQGSRSLWSLNPESFSSSADAQKVLDALNGEFPRPDRWREEVQLEADRNHKLVTRYGFVRYFWDVFDRRLVQDNYQPRGNERVMVNGQGRRWLLKPGGDAEAAIAFRPANDAFGMIRERMVELGRLGLDERYRLVNQIHDSLVFDCPRRDEEECLAQVKEILERPSEVLVDPIVAPGGLYCAVEAKIGPNLAEMRKI